MAQAFQQEEEDDGRPRGPSSSPFDPAAAAAATAMDVAVAPVVVGAAPKAAGPEDAIEEDDHGGIKDELSIGGILSMGPSGSLILFPSSPPKEEETNKGRSIPMAMTKHTPFIHFFFFGIGPLTMHEAHGKTAFDPSERYMQSARSIDPCF